MATMPGGPICALVSIGLLLVVGCAPPAPSPTAAPKPTEATRPTVGAAASPGPASPVASPSPVASASPAASASPVAKPAAPASPAAIATTGCAGGPYAEALIPGAPRVALEIAQTDPDRQRGLMGRQSMAVDQGMLFVFPQATRGGFWMRDTLIPLSIAFIEADGTIVDIQDMQPLDETPHAPPRPYRFALEVNQGWFAANRVKPGDRFRLCLRS